MDKSRIEELGRQIGELFEIGRGTDAADARKNREYLAGSVWRYAVTLHSLRDAFGRTLADATVLDLGAYPGHIAGHISKVDLAKVTALTLMTSPTFEARMRDLGVAVAVCDVERDALPSDDQSVDVVLCCELIEHLDGDVLHMLRETRRVLRADGLLLLTTPNHASAMHRWSLARGRSVYPALDNPDYPFYAGAGVRNPMRHVREFTVSEIVAVLSQAGFARISATTTSPPLGCGTLLSWRGLVITRALRVFETLTKHGGPLLVAIARP